MTGPGEHVPMVTIVEVLLTVRDSTDEPVVRLSLFDVTNDYRRVDLPESVVVELIGDLAVALRQLRRAGS